MMEKCFYINLSRVIMVILSLVAFIGTGMWLWGINCSYWVFAVCYGWAIGNAIFLYDKYFSVPPIEPKPNGIFNLNEVLEEECFDEDGNSLGVCTGAYLTKGYVSIMVDGKLYDIEDVYFGGDEDE